MSSLQMKPLRTLALLAAIALLTACGLKSGLEKPPPQFGEAHRNYVAQQKAAADEKAQKEKARQTVTIPTTSAAAPPPATTTTDIGRGINTPPPAPK